MSEKIDDQKTLCWCKNVSYGVVRRFIGEGDLKTVEQVMIACEAGGGCRSCHPEIRALLEEHRAERGSFISRFLKRFSPESKG